MSPWVLFFVASWLVRYAVLRVADALQLSALDRPIPEELSDLYPAAVREKTRRYLQARVRLRTVEATVELIALLAFWWLGGFGALDRWVRAAGWGEIGTGLLFVGGLALLEGLLGLPFDVWSTFGIEARFGFNRTTLGTFVADRVKGALLGAALGAPLLAAILWLFAALPGWAWLAAWAVTALFTLAVQWIVPTWILPLFYRFEPVEAPELRQAVLEYASSVGFPLNDLYAVDGSRRSSKANAFFTGLGRNRRVALFDTLIEGHTVPELVAVLAHEIGHYRLGHVPRMLALSLLHTGALFALLGWMLPHPGVYEAFGVATPSVYAGLVVFGILYSPVELLLSILVQWVSRRHEYEADAFAARTTGDPDPLASALRGLASDHLAHPTPHPFWVALHASHPPLAQRLSALRSSREG